MSGQAGVALHLVATAADGLVPFAGEAAALAAADVLRRLGNRLGAPVLAFAVLPGQVEVLLAAGPDPQDAAASFGRGLTRALNTHLGRRGALLVGPPEVTVLGDGEDWLTLADAIEARVSAEGLAPEPGAWPGCSAYPDHAEWIRALTAPSRSRTAPPTTASARPAEVPQLVGDAIAVSDVPLVVQLARLRPALATRDEAIERSLLAEWRLDDPTTQAVARRLVRGLAGPTGDAAMVTGLYGAGKSHLLGALALAARWPSARAALFGHQPALADLELALTATGDRLVVVVPLDEESPATSLEDVVFGAAQEALLAQTGQEAPLAEAAWVIDVAEAHLLPAHGEALDQAAGGDWRALAAADPDAAAAAAQQVAREAALPLTFARSRVERLALLLQACEAAGRAGVVFVLDELSLFLGAKGHAALQADASFLQFLGQRAELQPVWTLCALPKQLEDVGDIEQYSLRQIKDRFETRLSLPLAATGPVLTRRVLRRVDEQSFTSAVEATVAAWTGGARTADLSHKAVAATYPLHPLTFECLVSCAERFLAQTRSVLEFALAQVRGDELAPGVLREPVPALVTPDALWPHFARDIAPQPELRRYRELVWDYYQRNLPALVAGEDMPLADRLVALLLVLALAGIERSEADLAAALLPASEDRVPRVGGLLETLRRSGAYITVERRGGRGRDVWRIDLEADVNETIKRRARALEATLLPTDGRLIATAVECCVDDGFPLATALRPRATEVTWRQTLRPAFLALRDLRTLSADELTNQAAMLASPESDEAVFLYLGEPRAVEAQAAAFAGALAEVGDERWAHALVAWLPRAPAPEELRAWTEAVALELVRTDPTLAPDHPVRLRLDEESPARRAMLAELMGRLYGGGTVLARGRSEQVGSGTWGEVATRLIGAALDQLFPDFATVAPRRRLALRETGDQLVADFVVPGEVAESPGSPLAAQIEDFAQPLGLVSGEDGAYRLSIGADSPARALLERLPARPLTVNAVERWLAKSTWGLIAAQTELLLAAAIRRGYLEALDDRRTPVTLGAPLRSRVALVQPAELLTEAQQAALQPLSRAIFGRDLADLGRTQQQALWDRLVNWRAAALADLERVEAGLERVVAGLGGERLQWRGAGDVAERVRRLADRVDPRLPAREGLLRLVEESADLDEQCLPTFRGLVSFFETRLEAVLAAAEQLQVVELPADSSLASPREALLRRLAAGESLAADSEAWLSDYAAWRRCYVEAYLAWHAAAHGPERFAEYDAFRTSAPMRVLSNLSRLALDAPDGAAAVNLSLRTERLKQCRRGDVTPALRQGHVCDECRLPLGATVPLRPLAAIAAEAEAGVAAILEALRAPQHQSPLQAGLAALAPDDPRRAHIELLLAEPTGPAEALVNSTAYGLIDLLNGWLTTKVVASRKLSDLNERLAGQRLTKAQVLSVVARWLDPDLRLGDEGLIEVEE